MPKTLFSLIILWSTVFINLSCTSSENSDNFKQGFAPVKKIVDGDTFWLDDGSVKGIKIRLIGVDAPESRKTFRKEIGFFGKEAKAFLKNILAGKNVKQNTMLINLINIIEP